jgi:hypothetical protein
VCISGSVSVTSTRLLTEPTFRLGETVERLPTVTVIEFS